VRLLSALVARAPPPVRHPTFGDLLVAWRNRSMLDDRNGPEIEAIAASILLRSSPPDIRLRHANGREVVYARQITPCKPVVGRSQGYRRIAHGIRLLSNSVGAETSAAVVGGAVNVSIAGPNCPVNRGSGALAPITATPEQQLGLITRHGVSLAAFNGIRMGLGGSRVGLASIPALRESRKRLAGLPSKSVVVKSSGAHLMSISGAVHEKLAALSASNSFVERLLRDKNLNPIPQTEAYEPPSVDAPVSGSAAPPANVKDVHLTLGLDKGGDPSSVKIVVGIVNQTKPQKLSNTILVAVCPASKDNYDEVAEMLGEHLEQVRELVRGGVVVGGVRRAVRLFLNGDYEALCTVHGHKGPSATMPCLNCLSIKAPSDAQAALADIYGTLQDVDTSEPPHSRSASHLEQMKAAGAPGDAPGRRLADLSQAAHRSINRPPLFTIDPRQIVPIPLHLLLGITLRLLKLAVELVISCRCRDDGESFAYELAETLRRVVRVGPVPYHGGVFIGRHCHKIAEGRDAVCRTLLGLVPEHHHQAYKRLWLLWGRLGRTLNRAAVVQADEIRQFRTDARNFVRLMKRSFP